MGILNERTKIMPKGIAGTDEVSETGVANGTYSVYVNLNDAKRVDFSIVQDGGSGTASTKVYASWDDTVDGDETTLTYYDVTGDYRDSSGTAITEVTDTEAILRDSTGKLTAAHWARLDITIAGASADASYTINANVVSKGY